MTLWQALILAIVQGATEFLPVSSTAHLVIAEKMMGLKLDDFAGFAVMLHFGTLLAVVVYYRRDLWGMLRSLWTWGGAQAEEMTASRKLLGLLAVGTIPALVVGLWFEHLAKGTFEQTGVIGVALLCTAAYLWFGQWYGRRLDGRRELGQTGWRDALVIGLMQAVSAVFRGFSRSGSTVSTGLTLGLSRDWAPRFAFLLSFPVILGSSLVEGRHLLHAHLSAQELQMAAFGIVVAALVGLVAIHALVSVVRRGNLAYFSAYCAVLGVIVLVAVSLGHL